MTDLITIGKNAKLASAKLIGLSSEDKNRVLLKAADALEDAVNVSEILSANQKDLENAEKNGMSEGLKDRLRLTEARLHDMASAVRDITGLPDPVGATLETIERPNGLRLVKTAVPIGVVGIIYEARPNVTSDAWSLCFKTSNAVILKGGSDAINSNMAIVAVIRRALEASGVDPDSLILIEATDHETTNRFMQLNDYVDVIIPRGSKRLIKAVVDNASVPVIETGAGNCHIYIEKSGEVEKAVPIVYNAKTQRIGVCNACESLVVDRDALPKLVPVVEKLQEKSVTVYADEEAYEILEEASKDGKIRMELVEKASEEDFSTEYLDYKISVKTVSGVSEAIYHINSNSTHHSEAIISEDPAAAEKFLNEIDSACVYWNASTRFTDGGCFGFGAEIGISTSKLHARGPMGLRELTTYKYRIYGNGQVR
ncbi:MAG: glutamate-5-semialdehyde dehydrogenase [Lachnospiraceae bacterium]|jgi:glutamate-5-semialdehyde dehydrogenase|nr:glutamate-5-semialdehyde dehydrogenase [Lachnospiraceae bacterium]